MKNTALILVDIQNDYFPNGRMELYETEKAAANARKLLDLYRSKIYANFSYSAYLP